MELKQEVQERLSKAHQFVIEGVGQILSNKLDEKHGVSASPGATALASLALLALGRGFDASQQRGIRWLWQQRQGGWGKYPGDKPDDEITKIVQTVLQGSQGGWMARMMLLAQARQFSHMILSLGQRVVPGLEGPTADEIVLPNLLEERVLSKLPLYGRPVIVAASLLATNHLEGIAKGVQYLNTAQLPDGSWAEDIVATSLGILALMRHGGVHERLEKAGQWLVHKQYPSGGWPTFDQLQLWAMSWTVSVLGETVQIQRESPWLNQAVQWLLKAQNTDGSYGTTPPYTHPDLDDTAVALVALHQITGKENSLGVQLLKRLQNENGSWGTFPFFQGIPPNISSEFPVYIPSVDVSIHAIEALWRRSWSQEQSVWRGVKWVLSQQDERGAFPASWFEGDVYSTAQALELFSKWRLGWERWNIARHIHGARKKSQEFLILAQSEDGGWGSVVETGLALSGLWHYARYLPNDVIHDGIKYLLETQKNDGSFEPSYRGIYAKGWNYEEPITTTLTAIRALRRFQSFPLHFGFKSH